MLSEYGFNLLSPGLQIEGLQTPGPHAFQSFIGKSRAMVEAHRGSREGGVHLIDKLSPTGQ